MLRVCGRAKKTGEARVIAAKEKHTFCLPTPPPPPTPPHLTHPPRVSSCVLGGWCNDGPVERIQQRDRCQTPRGSIECLLPLNCLVIVTLCLIVLPSFQLVVVIVAAVFFNVSSSISGTSSIASSSLYVSLF